MSKFFRFPHTPHLKWLGSLEPRGDKVLSPQEVEEFLSRPVWIEEKLDGANLGFSLDTNGAIRAQNRGSFLVPPYSGQFRPLSKWLEVNEERLFDALSHAGGSSLVLFGEWCAARHTVRYTHLPDRWLAFDVYDMNARAFWSSRRRSELADEFGFSHVQTLRKGFCSEDEILRLANRTVSAFGDELVEGLVIRHDSDFWSEDRAKIVRSDFTQAISEHWRSRPIEWNLTAVDGSSVG